jgi:heme a synthase
MDWNGLTQNLINMSNNPQKKNKSDIWFNRFLWFTALNVLALLGLGGLVTSKGVGMAVPDWPTTFGYNMFLLPWDKWVMGGGVFEEHSHRVFASWIGLLTLGVGGGLAFLDPRKWVRRLGYLAIFLVILQGVLGGLRVRLMRDEIGVFHAALAQVFLCLMVGLAWVRNRAFEKRSQSLMSSNVSRLGSGLLWALTGMIFLQLILGAVMRHQHAGLAVPDFPKAYGSWAWPATDEETVRSINEEQWITGEASGASITGFQINVHMSHRVGAILVTLLALWTACRLWRWSARDEQNSNRLQASALLSLLALQIALGAGTIWTRKSADVATFHMLTGAILLVTSFLISIQHTQCLVKVFGFASQSKGNESERLKSPGSNAKSRERVIAETKPVGKEQQEVTT